MQKDTMKSTSNWLNTKQKYMNTSKHKIKQPTKKLYNIIFIHQFKNNDPILSPVQYKTTYFPVKQNKQLNSQYTMFIYTKQLYLQKQASVTFHCIYRSARHSF